MSSKSLILASKPQGLPTNDNFRIETHPIPKINDGEVLAKTLFISVDPYLRLIMGGIFSANWGVGTPIIGHHVGEVIESKNARFPVGSVIAGTGPFAEYFSTPGDNYRIVDHTVPLSLHIGALGMPGLTAYFGFLDLTKPKAGETVVVSGAAGAVGSLVGQLAKSVGLKTIGIAGSDEKVKHLTEKLAYDRAFNYKTTPNLLEALKEAAPNGVDIYFDNVGGELSDAVYRLLNVHARVSVCGQITEYNESEDSVGPRFGKYINLKRLRIEGFMVNDYKDRHPEGYKALTNLYKEGKLIADETILEGFEKIPEAFIGLFTGKNTGKMIIKIAELSHK